MENADLLKWVNATLHNDEFSTDEELILYFRTNGLTQQQAEKAVQHRTKCLNETYYNIELDSSA